MTTHVSSLITHRAHLTKADNQSYAASRHRLPVRKVGNGAARGRADNRKMKSNSLF